jgi:hypothetical protein
MASLGAIATVHAVQATYYVSTAGNDSNAGTSPAAAWATLIKARDHVRASKGSMTGDIIVNILAGDYYVAAPVAFTDSDSGNNGYKVIYKNYDATGSARFIGGQLVTGWTLHSGNIYKANVGTSFTFETLYENGRRADKARYPNRSSVSSRATYLSSEGVNDSRTVLQYKSTDLGSIGSWNLSQAEVFIWSGDRWDWFTDVVPITSVNTGTRQITLSQSTRYPINQSAFHVDGSRYFIQGSLDLLDQPGEFYLDKAAGYLYYWPRDGAISSQRIIAPRTKTIISVAGASDTSRAHDIEFSGLTIEGTDFTTWYRYGWVAAGDSGESHTYPAYDRQIEMPIHRTGMVFLTNADHVSITNCVLRNSGYSAIYAKEYNQSHIISGNLIENVGYCGVVLQGRYAGEGDVVKNNLITNNLIRKIGELLGHAAGVRVQNASSNEVSYSEIHDTPRYAVTWGASIDIPKADIYAKDNIFRYLKIANGAQDSGDTAPIYAWGISATAPYLTNTVQQVTMANAYADTSMTDYAPYGVYMDNQTYGQTFTNVKLGSMQGGTMHNNQSGSHSQTNVSWVAGFNDSLMDYANIGTTSSFLYRDLFGEGFESSLIHWTTRKGTPTTSSTQKFAGATSFVSNQDTDVISHEFPTNRQRVVTIRFYDDATNVNSQVMARVSSGNWDDAAGRWLGVSTPTSTTNYVYRVGGTFTASSVARSTGWHELRWDYTSGTKVDLFIDGTLVASPTGVTSYNYIAMGDWWADTRTSTCYFDEVKELFADSFENGRSAWSEFKSRATISSAQSLLGAQSYLVDQDTDVITTSLPSIQNRELTLWFYDDASNLNAQVMARADASGPEGSTGRWLGVATGTSTTKYVYRVDGTYTASAVNRTTGWHELCWDYTSGTDVKLFIDGILVKTQTGVTGFNHITMGDWWADSKTSTAYFDDVRVF